MEPNSYTDIEVDEIIRLYWKLSRIALAISQYEHEINFVRNFLKLVSWVFYLEFNLKKVINLCLFFVCLHF